MVQGGGVPDSIDRPKQYVQRRCDEAAKLAKIIGDLKKRKINRESSILGNFRQLSTNSELESLPILCLSAGTSHLPQLMSEDGLPIWESLACASYLAEHHGLFQDVYVETTSYDTIGNAYFARTTHADVNGWRHILVITSEFHLRRTKTIFDWIFLLCDNEVRNGNEYQLFYLSTPNIGLPKDVVEARKEREAKSEQMVREKVIPRYQTLRGVWLFLNKSHALHTASKLVERAKGKRDTSASDAVKKSYGSG
eukprot:CAMPEP_0113653660 /NCGR_PEP_ID=MMETSP0017_2-20120614/28711_1 /TAXON_ID=2856 /ORGANISM="Cylindrotheca closterium" /LENGTH=251 /DNA_ID=CAMNT_0000566695 /DNA_START=957 /DNA_END=1712 /DNA_ORIENTATION=- /assembly_acc=CAM_ASM_000147